VKRAIPSAALLFLALSSCTGSGTPPPPPTVFGGDRPVTLHVPPQYDPSEPMPLVVVLHGYAASGAVQELYFELTPQADSIGFLYLHPDGSKDAQGSRYWNATDACCDFARSGVDDSAYLIGLVHEVQDAYNVDPKRIYFVGHSNGGFMAHRMACDHADTIAAIVSLAGAMPLDSSLCTPDEPVSALQIHGTADAVIAYDGGTTASSVNPNGAEYPGAMTTIEAWAALDGCALDHDDASPPLDLDSSIAGNETTASIYAEGCAPGGHAELWTIEGGGHIPALSPSFAPLVVQFLMAHPKP
jgi:polyhydroxybutyrate depolymerase